MNYKPNLIKIAHRLVENEFYMVALAVPRHTTNDQNIQIAETSSTTNTIKLVFVAEEARRKRKYQGVHRSA